MQTLAQADNLLPSLLRKKLPSAIVECQRRLGEA